MTFPEIKLVDSPSASAGVLFDFNADDQPCKRLVLNDDGDPIRFGVPEVQGDPEAVAPLYGNRVVEFQCRLTGTKPNVSAALSSLSRAMLLNFGQVWLSVRLNETSQFYFFKVFRPDPGQLSFENIITTSAGRIENWELPISLPCEPFAYGERVSLAFGASTTATISNDPTAATNPLSLVLPAIIGDAPTPLDVTFSSISPMPFQTAITVSGYSSIAPISAFQIPIGSSDGATAQTDCSDPITAAGFVGNSYRQITFATAAASTSRLRFKYATGTTSGRYRAFLRASSSDSASFRETTYVARVEGASADISFTLTYDGTSKGTWVDLGTLATANRLPESPNAGRPNPPVTGLLYVGRVNGTGKLNLDHIMLIPLDLPGGLTYRQLRVDGQSANFIYMDGTFGDVSSGATGQAVEAAGNFVVATPGAFNTLFFNFASSPAMDDDPAATKRVMVSYYPRYLHPLSSGA